jgi:predicted RNase H-like nuclease (RuvC/YqgF family)
MQTRKGMVAILLTLLCNWAAAQDSQSLGDVARQTKQHKPSNGAQSAEQPAESAHVVTNDEIPEHPERTNLSSPSDDAPTANKDAKRPAEYWKAQILQTKKAIASLQRNIDSLSSSIHFSQGNYEKHVAWNERQRQKQQEVENMKSQLDRFQKHLEELQESARRQGYGSSVYEP